MKFRSSAGLGAIPERFCSLLGNARHGELRRSGFFSFHRKCRFSVLAAFNCLSKTILGDGFARQKHRRREPLHSQVSGDDLQCFFRLVRLPFWPHASSTCLPRRASIFAFFSMAEFAGTAVFLLAAKVA